MFYVIESKYVGPNIRQATYVDAHYYDITTVAGRTNSSNDERHQGALGTTNDWSRYAHGAYDTIDAARDILCNEILAGEYRSADEMLESWDREEHGIIERYKPGRYTPWGPEATENWAYEGIQSDVTPAMTDEDIDQLVQSYLEIGRTEDQAELDADALRRAMEYRRVELTDQTEDAAE